MQWSCADEVICSSVTTRCKSTKKEYFSLAFESCLHVPCLWKCHSVSDFPDNPTKSSDWTRNRPKAVFALSGEKLLVFLLEHIRISLFLIHIDAAWGRQSYLSPHRWTGHVAVRTLSSPLAVAALLLITAWQLWLQITGLLKGWDYQVALSQEKEEFT